MNLFGWIPPESRTEDEHAAHDAAVRSMPKFGIKGRTVYGKKVSLFDFSKEANGGKHWDPQRQEDGSCVGQGGGRVIWTLSAVQKVKLGDLISTVMPFFLYTYGVSRYLLNPRGGRGDGSAGSTFAKAAMLGTPPSDAPGLPTPDRTNGICYGKATERQWSFSPLFDPKWKDVARNYPVRTTALVTSVDDVRDAIVNGHPVTIASNWGGMVKRSGGREIIVPCPIESGVLLNKRGSVWPHQMCVLAWWEHDVLGELFWVQNSWGPKIHGICPSGAPLGGFWVRALEIAYIVKQKESFAFSSFKGFPAQNMDIDAYI